MSVACARKNKNVPFRYKMPQTRVIAIRRAPMTSLGAGPVDTIYCRHMAAWQAVLLVLGLLIFETFALSGKNHTLYLLSLLSYPNNNTSLEPSFTDANDIIPGAYLAVSDINNRSDVLPDYQLELIAADDGCNISWIGIINLINNLYYVDHKQIVGIVGPRCSDSTKAVASLTGRPEIALLNVHLGTAPELANRTLYPYSYGISPPTSFVVDAIVALFSYNKWTRAAVLYNPDMLIDYNSFVLFQNKIMGIANLTFISPASLTVPSLGRVEKVLRTGHCVLPSRRNPPTCTLLGLLQEHDLPWLPVDSV